MTSLKQGKKSRKNNIIVCNGYTGKKNELKSVSCYKYVQCDNCEAGKCNCGKSQEYCDTHLYFENFTDKDIKSIKEEDENFYVCLSCGGWRTNKKCYSCVKKYEREKERLAEKRKERTECDVLKSCGVKCSSESYKVVNGKNI